MSKLQAGSQRVRSSQESSRSFNAELAVPELADCGFPSGACSYGANALISSAAAEEKAQKEEQKAALEPLCRLVKDILGDKVRLNTH